MIILSAVIIGLIIGFIRKGSLSGIKSISKWPLGLVGILILIGMHYLCYIGSFSSIASFLPILSFIGYILILITLILNLDDLFSIALAVGITGNFVVSFLNQGYMPVQQSIIDLMPQSSVVTESILNGTNAVYSVMNTNSTLLWFLGDVLPVKFLGSVSVFTGSVPGISAGTIFIFIGLVGWIQLIMAKAKKKPVQISQEIFTDERPVSKSRTPHFESKTEELFFEDGELPNDPLDELFEDEPDQTEFLPEMEAQPPKTSPVKRQNTDYIDDLPDYLRPDTEYEPTSEEGDVVPTGFFTQSYNAQKNVGNRAFGTEEFPDDTTEFNPIHTAPLEPIEEVPEFEPTGDVFVEEEQEQKQTSEVPRELRSGIAQQIITASTTEEDQPSDTILIDAPKPLYDDEEEYFTRQPTPRKRYDIEEGSSYVVSKAYTEEMARKDRTQEEMLSVWAQVAEDQKNLKNSRRRQSRMSYSEDNPYLDERKRREAAKLAKQEAEAQAREREKEKLLEEQRQHTRQTEEIFKNSNPQEEEDVIMTDEDRVAAGYEKVSFQISGRDVSFWKKKKD